MQRWKKIIIAIIYIIFIFMFLKYNASLIVEMLNKSLFEDYDMNIDLTNVNNSFFNGTSLVFLMFLLMYAIIGTFIVSVIITNLILGIFVYANQIKILERNEFITYKELQTIITSPKELFSFVEMSLSKVIFSSIIIAVLLIFIHYVIKKVSHKIGFNINGKLRVLILIFTLVSLLFVYLQPNFYNEYVLKYEETNRHNFDPVRRAKKDGFLPTFVHTIRPNYMDAPKQYNKQTILKIEEQYSKLANEINRTRVKDINDSQTILYLSETLMDPDTIPQLLENETPIPFVTKLVDENIGGSMYSQYIGGGTANIEWSVLTSFSLELFNDPLTVTPFSDFYIQASNHHTFLSLFEKEKVAIHPYTAQLYKRLSVYDAIGFDDFLYLDNGIEHTEKLGNHRRVSDRALHKDLLRVLSNENVGLTHVLSMQNHSPFTREIPDMEYQPLINLDVYPSEKKKELKNYLQGLKATDDALIMLIDAIEKSNQEVNLILYGDHLPSIFNGLENRYSESQLHSTPWFVYMNHERSNKKEHFEELSPMFLAPMLLKEGGYKVTPFYGLLIEMLENDIKRVGKDFVITSQGILQVSELESRIQMLVNDYQQIVYDALFGSNYLSEEFFTKVE